MRARPWTRAIGVVAALLLVGARHPMHTAVTEITHSAGAPTMGIHIRVFADDFGAVAAGEPGSATTDSVMSRYVRGRLAIADASGRPVALKWVGARREGDVILLTLDAPATARLRGVRMLSGLLSERFEDQINIVRATYDGRTTTLLFMPGDGPKVLP
jgi:hypothetical protein